MIQDFLKRIDNYKSAYEPTSKDDYKVFYFYFVLFKYFLGNQNYQTDKFGKKRKIYFKILSNK